MSMNDIRGRHLGASPLLATVSGIASTTISMIDWFARETCFDIITTKSLERLPNPGNREPVITEPRPGCFGNAVGIRNPGMDVMFTRLRALREAWRETPPRAAGAPLLNVSLSGSSAEDFAVLAGMFSQVADLLELNFSCPHAEAGFGAAIGSSRSAIEEITRAVMRTATVPVYVKLTPNVEDIGAMAAAAVDAGADGIVAINTVGPAVYVEPDSGAPVLTNPPYGKGGMSGAWVYERALEAVASIRKALGPDVPLIGMGGVGSAGQVREMHAAGADAVGIGSILGTLHQREWPGFAAGLRDAAAPAADQSPAAGRCPDPADGPIPLDRTRMSYRRCTAAAIESPGPEMVELTLEEGLDCAPGQTVFLWIPGVGEKPFAAAASAPAVFVVRIKGKFTRALADLRPGDRLYLRGPYGDRHAMPGASGLPGTPSETAGTTERVLMAVAGTGIAAVSTLVHELLGSGAEVRVLLGLRDSATNTLLSRDPVLQGVTRVVHDEGVIGRVLDTFAESLSGGPSGGGTGTPTDPRWNRVYTVGPEPFMDRAADLAVAAGIDPGAVFVSLERTMLCGVGLCGACSCDGELTCRHGTFVTAAKLGAERFREIERGGARDD